MFSVRVTRIWWSKSTASILLQLRVGGIETAAWCEDRRVVVLDHMTCDLMLPNEVPSVE